MRYELDFNRLEVNNKKIPLDLFVEAIIILVFITSLLLLNIHSNLFFHTVIEIFMNVIYLIAFVFIFNTYRINKNNFLLVFGTGYFFVAVLGIIHMLTFSGMPFLSREEGLRIAPQLWIASRYLAAFTSLFSLRLILRPSLKINPYILFIKYLCVSSVLIISILGIKVFPACYIVNKGLTPFKIASEYLIIVVFMTAAALFYKLRKRVVKSLFLYIEAFFILSALCGLFFTSYLNVYEWTTVVGHIINAAGAYFLYKVIVEIGLKRPYDIINSDLNAAGSKIKEFEKVIFSNDKCQDFVINNSESAIVVTCDNRFVFANERMAELLGARATEDIVGQEITSVIPYEVREKALGRIEGAFRKKEGIPYTESKLLRVDGQVIDVEATNCYFLYHGRPALITMFRDISDKKQIIRLEKDIIEEKKLTHKAAELNKMLTEFFSNISHELKTPLNVILGAIQIMMLSDNNTTGSGKYLKTMKQNCYRLLRLVNNLIDLSKFDSGYFKLSLKNYNIVNVVEDITLSVADYIEQKGIEIVFDTDTEERMMAVDVDKIERVMLNLLSNSIKFTDKGGQILVNLWDREDSVVISIKDTGVGIPEDKLNIIFDRFGQVDKTLSRNQEGSGIGLSIVKSIVEMHGGSVEVQSKFGEGSEFIVGLPVSLIDEAEADNKLLFESKVEKISIEFSDIYS